MITGLDKTLDVVISCHHHDHRLDKTLDVVISCHHHGHRLDNTLDVAPPTHTHMIPVKTERAAVPLIVGI